MRGKRARLLVLAVILDGAPLGDVSRRYPHASEPRSLAHDPSLASTVAMIVPSVGKILNDAQVSLAVHKKCVKQMIQRRHMDQDTFLPELCNAILPVLLEFKVRLRVHGTARGMGISPRLARVPAPRHPLAEPTVDARGDLRGPMPRAPPVRPPRDRRAPTADLRDSSSLRTPSSARPVRRAHRPVPHRVHRFAPRGSGG